jgi:hypothetical protein
MSNPVPDTNTPSVHEPEADVPLKPLEDTTDQRVLDVAREAFNLQLSIRNKFSDNPGIELACRYIDLAVQAVHNTAPDDPPGAVAAQAARVEAAEKAREHGPADHGRPTEHP